MESSQRRYMIVITLNILEKYSWVRLNKNLICFLTLDLLKPGFTVKTIAYQKIKKYKVTQIALLAFQSFKMKKAIPFYKLIQMLLKLNTLTLQFLVTEVKINFVSTMNNVLMIKFSLL